MDKLNQIIELLTQIEINTRKASRKRVIKKEKKLLEKDEWPTLMRLWNVWSERELPKVENVTVAQSRYQKAIDRWNEISKEDYWVGVIRRINVSDFCQGKVKKWKADFDWFVRPDTAPRVMAGKLDNKNQKAAKSYFGTAEDGTKLYR